jgi:hypothetical protein
LEESSNKYIKEKNELEVEKRKREEELDIIENTKRLIQNSRI